jgi:hypothetical protein
MVKDMYTVEWLASFAVFRGANRSRILLLRTYYSISSSKAVTEEAEPTRHAGRTCVENLCSLVQVNYSVFVDDFRARGHSIPKTVDSPARGRRMLDSSG